jgi:hypothetical protein
VLTLYDFLSHFTESGPFLRLWQEYWKHKYIVNSITPSLFRFFFSNGKPNKFEEVDCPQVLGIIKMHLP